MKNSKILLSLCALLAAAPLTAGFAAEQDRVVFGGARCGSPFACSSIAGADASSPAIAQLLNVANDCMEGRLGITAPGGLFEQGFGLDYKKCFTPKSVKKAAQGYTMIPVCCVVEDSSGADSCYLQCNATGQR